MAIVSVQPKGSGRKGSVVIGGKWQSSRAFVVLTDDANDGDVAVLLAAGVPRVGDVHPEHSRMFMQSKSAGLIEDSEAGRKSWLVQCDYGTLTNDQKNKLVHPLHRPPEIRSNFTRLEAAAVSDVFGNILLNSAMRPFDPPIAKQSSRKVLSITKNKPAQSGVVGLLFADAVNLYAYLGAPPGTLKISNGISEQLVIEEYGEGDDAEEVEYWPWTVEFEFNPDTWDALPANMGREMLFWNPFLPPRPPSTVPGGYAVKPLTEADGNTQISLPVPLDRDGQEIPKDTLPGAAIYGVMKSPPIYGVSNAITTHGTIGPAQIYHRRDFKALQLL